MRKKIPDRVNKSERPDEKVKRRELRERIFQLLFRREFHSEDDMPEQIRLFFESMGEIHANDEKYINDKYNAIASHITEIDNAINEVAEGWKTDRMGRVDLSIIRLAYYEMQYDEDVPVSVAINEAVEIAKVFGGEESPSFVNGILAKLARKSENL